MFTFITHDMSHLSVKIRLALPIDKIKGILEAIEMVSFSIKAESHADSVYGLKPGTAIKVRTYDDGRQELILEKINQNTSVFRHSNISISFVRKTQRDDNPNDILGIPNFHFYKKRTRYDIKSYEGLRVYHDQLKNGQEFLEFQIDSDNAKFLNSEEDLRHFVLSLGFEEKDFIFASYEDIFKNDTPQPDLKP